MHFINDYVSDEDDVAVTVGDTEVTLKDGSTHLVPVVNTAALRLLSKRRLEKDEDHEAVQETGHHQRGNSLRNYSMSTVATKKRKTEGECSNKEEENVESETDFFFNKSWLDIGKLLLDKESLIQHLRKYKLLPSEFKCEKCLISMTLRENSKTSDGYVFKCNTCKSTKSIRTGSFFTRTKLSFENVYGVLYLWSVGIQGHIIKEMMPSMRPNTMYDFMNFARDICCEVVDKNPVVFTNENEIQIEIQIDESIFGKRQKYHRGKTFGKQWVFGISQSSLHKCSLHIVEDRTQETLCGIIKRHVPTTGKVKIISDGWASYATLNEMGYEHSAVVHKEEFVNSKGDHTNSIESVWSQMKLWIKNMHGVKREHLGNYLKEFQYRYNLCGSARGNCWRQLHRDIATIYKV